MPRYYFDIRDDTGRLDDEVGEEFFDDAAATREAVKVLTSIARDVVTTEGSLSVAVRRNQERLFDMTLTISVDRTFS